MARRWSLNCRTAFFLGRLTEISVDQFLRAEQQEEAERVRFEGLAAIQKKSVHVYLEKLEEAQAKIRILQASQRLTMAYAALELSANLVKERLSVWRCQCNAARQSFLQSACHDAFEVLPAAALAFPNSDLEPNPHLGLPSLDVSAAARPRAPGSSELVCLKGDPKLVATRRETPFPAVPLDSPD